jgi:hypothetical protein
MLSQNTITALSREHIKYVLGIDISLNESISNDTARLIVERQLLYETFLDTIKDAAKETWSKVVTKINDLTSAATVLGRVLSNKEKLAGFTNNLLNRFKKGPLKELRPILEKLGLSDLMKQVENVYDKVQAIKIPWQKLLVTTGIYAIGKYIVDVARSFPGEKIKEFILQYFSDKGLGEIISKLSNFTSFLSWLTPIIKTVDIVFNILEPSIQRFGLESPLPSANNQAQPQNENKTNNMPKFSVGDSVKWENQDWTIELIANGKYKLKHSKGLPSTWTSVDVLDSQNENKTNNTQKANIDQLKRGIEVEMEHTKDIKDKTKKLVFALKIAIDHLKEDPEYYDKLDSLGLEEEGIEEYNEGEFCAECLKEYMISHKDILTEAEYQGRKVQLGKPMAGDVKKFKVYVKNAKGKVVKVNFGQKGVKIKKNNPKRRKSFRARHNCDNPGPRWKARYWSCRKW